MDDFEIRDGALVTKATGPDPYMIRSACRIPPGAVSAIVLRMRVTAGSGPSIYWTTTDSPAFAEDKVVRFKSIPDGQFHEYRIDVAAHGMWQGKTITALRLDATNGAPGAEIAVDYIRGQ